MDKSGDRPDRQAPAFDNHVVAAPEMPFGIGEYFWKAALIVFSIVLVIVTVLALIAGVSPVYLSVLYVVPSALFAYFFRRQGVLVVYLLAMYYFALTIWFRYPAVYELWLTALQSILFIAIALVVSYLTDHLLEESRKYRAIFDNTENGVVMVERETLTIRETNQRFAAALQLPEDAVIGKPLVSFLSDASTRDRLIRCLAGEQAVPTQEVMLVQKDGTVWTAVVAARRISREYAVLTFINITERKKVDERARVLKEEADLYLDIMTHDLNNLNTASLNNAALLAGTSGDYGRRIATNLVRALEKGNEIIQNVSALRRIHDQLPAKIPVHLSEIIKKEIAHFPDARIRYGGEDAVVLADEMLPVVFSNLIGNSIKHGGEGAEVWITVRDNGADVQVSVEDSGAGIPGPLRPYLFERFQRGDTKVGGKGLGLYICRMLVERYGGWIWVDDRVPQHPAQGAAIRFTLPKAA
jgi:PAS domain S-box-containing protein